MMFPENKILDELFLYEIQQAKDSTQIPKYNKKHLLEVFYKKGTLKYVAKFTEKHPCRKILFLIKIIILNPATLLKETSTQILLFCEIFKNTCERLLLYNLSSFE